MYANILQFNYLKVLILQGTVWCPRRDEATAIDEAERVETLRKRLGIAVVEVVAHDDQKE